MRHGMLCKGFAEKGHAWLRNWTGTLRTLIKYLAETLRKFAHGECKAGAEARRAAQGIG